MALMAGLLALAIGMAPPATPQTQLGGAMLAEIGGCLQGSRWSFDARHTPASRDEAPGLPDHITVARIADAPGRLFVYQDGGGSVIECGVAVYDPLPQDFIFLVGAAIRTAKPGLAPHSADAWRLDGAPGLSGVYWGDRLAPGLSGVLVRGGDGVHAPGLQLDSHTVLVK